MKIKKIIDDRAGGVRIKVELIEGELGAHDYGIPRNAWIRGARLMGRFGAERALELIDERALRATERRDYDTARRWRTLITAIHAIQEDEPLPGQEIH